MAAGFSDNYFAVICETLLNKCPINGLFLHVDRYIDNFSGIAMKRPMNGAFNAL